MKRLLRFYIFLMTGFVAVTNLCAQTLEIKDVIPDDYPEIRAKFFLYDSDGEIVRDINPDDIIITDNNIQRATDFTFCSPLTKFSSILTIDISYSMTQTLDSFDIHGQQRIDLAREGAKLWVDSLPEGRAECAITTFNYTTNVDQYFTTDRDSLKAAIDTATQNPEFGTNYNGALLFDRQGNEGALELARTANYKPILVFLTDGEHDKGAYGEVKVDQIIALADELNATIYCITLGMPMPEELIYISENTGGFYYENLNDAESVNAAYLEILQDAADMGTPIPCELTWLTDCGGGELNIKVPAYNNASASTDYDIPESIQPFIEIEDRYNYFVNSLPGADRTAKIKITARNNYLEINNADISDNNFSVTDWNGTAPPFTLEKDSSRLISLTYSPYSDSLYHPVNITLEGSSCDSAEFYLSGGWAYPLDINAGMTDTLVTKTVEDVQAFCNYTGKDVKITRFFISGENAAEFVLQSPPSNLIVPHDTCITLSLEFTPLDIGRRKAKFGVIIEGDTLYSDIQGIGAGKPDIGSADSYAIRMADCSTEYIDTVITIQNIGADDLYITDIKLSDDNSVYSLLSLPSLPDTLEMEESADIAVRFMPLSAGAYPASIIITSNAISSEETALPLSGKKDSINFMPVNDTIGLGVVCPDEELSSQISIMNTGDVLTGVNISSELININTKETNINPSETKDITFNVASGGAGIYSEEITISDDICGIEKKVIVQWESEYPSLSTGTLYLISKPGTKKDTVIKFVNTGKRELTIENAEIDEAVFTINGPALPVSIMPGDTLELDVSYYPLVEEVVSAELTIEGAPCGFKNTFEISGNSSLSVAEIAIEEHTGLIGDIVTIPVLFRESHKFARTRTDSIKFKVMLDGTLLEPVEPTLSLADISNSGDNIILSMPYCWVDSAGYDQTLTEMKFLVKNSANTSTPLNVIEVSSNGYEVYYIQADGLFSISPAHAKIYIDTTHTAESGDAVEIPIYMSDMENVADFHGTISTTLKMNATLLYPIDGLSLGTVEDTVRTINLSGLQIPSDGDSVLTVLKFQAMIGTEASTAIEITNTASEFGVINFEEVPGRFTLSGVDGLFNPFISAGFLHPYPNPTIGWTTIYFEVVDHGVSKITLRDPIGKEVLKIIEQNFDPGQYETSFNASNFAAGMYFLVLDTPSQRLIRRLNIVR